MAISKQDWVVIGDMAGRVGIIAYFGLSGWGKVLSIAAAITNWPTLAIEHKELWLVSQVTTLLFFLIVVCTTLFRLKPVHSSEGIESRVTALAGTYLLGFLAQVPDSVQLPPLLTAFATLLIIVGFGASVYVMRWLGRSFSIMAEARRLVTHGPYANVRHPLYLTEEIAVIGVVLLNLSPLAVLLAAVHWALQLRRMRHEEATLTAAFPDYTAYAAVTPRIIPNLFRTPARA